MTRSWTADKNVKARFLIMNGRGHTRLSWIIIRMGEDGKWWVDEFSDEEIRGGQDVSVLAPEQVRHVIGLLGRLRSDGYRQAQFSEAFQAWRLESELSDGRVRLVPSEESFFDGGSELYALPDVPLTLDDELQERGVYPDFLEKLEHIRIHNLNRTHSYAHDVDEQEMEDELGMTATDRYYCGYTVHVFDEMCEILDWAPEEWEGGEE